MKTLWLPTCDLRWNAGALEQKFRAMNPGPEYGTHEWREVPDALPRRDDVATPSISRKDMAAALVTGEAPRVRLDGGFGKIAGAEDDMIAPGDAVHLTEGPLTAASVAIALGERPAVFYEFTVTPHQRFRSISPVQFERAPGFWKEVSYNRKPAVATAPMYVVHLPVGYVRSRSRIEYSAEGLGHWEECFYVVEGTPIADDPAAGATLAAVTKERDELRKRLRNAHAMDDRNQAAAVRERDELLAAIKRATAGNADLAAALKTEREANEALNAKCMRQDTQIAVLRDEIEETRGKRNEWQRRALSAEGARNDATSTLARIRKFCDEVRA